MVLLWTTTASLNAVRFGSRVDLLLRVIIRKTIIFEIKHITNIFVTKKEKDANPDMELLFKANQVTHGDQ